MRYEEKYKSLKVGSIPEPALMRMNSSGTCWKCKSRTEWLDVGFGAYMCSEECRSGAWKDEEKKTLGDGSEMAGLVASVERLQFEWRELQTKGAPPKK